jgi:hypothetical protein
LDRTWFSGEPDHPRANLKSTPATLAFQMNPLRMSKRKKCRSPCFSKDAQKRADKLGPARPMATI